MNKNYFTIIYFFIFVSSIYSQNNSELDFINDFIIPLKKHQIEVVEKRKESLKDSFLLKYVECQIDNIKYKNIDDSTFSKFESYKRTTYFQNAIYHINKGDYIFNKQKYVDSKVIEHYEIAYNIANNNNDKYLACESLRRICSYLFKTQKNVLELNQSINRYKNFIYDDFEDYQLSFYTLGYKMQEASINQRKINSNLFYSLLTKAKKTKNALAIGESLQLIGVYYLIFNQNIDSTLYYNSMAKKQYNNYNTAYCKIKSIGLEINQSILLQQKGEYQKSLEKLDSIRTFKIPNQNLREQLSIYQFLKSAYLNLNDYKTAYNLQSKEKAIEDSLDLIKHKIAIADIQTAYQTKEKEQENFQLKKDKRSLWIGSLVFILFGSITFFLIQKNTKRKQLLAEQEKKLETQKLATVLKEQELTSIDAMIEGQEKERQRIANDLHDDLGGLMATVKMHFNALQDKQSPELFDKTNTLLDEAYNKIRTVAHAKNSGVIAKQGLLKAVQTMANKISIDNKIEIDVIDHGLENRLENSLELTIFRIIQELITNVIKHANASQTTIHLTNHEDILNIMVEDNGKGFNPNQITKTTKGMGISSIDKRVEHLNGTMTIESEINQGTSIIIDIPL